MLRSTRHQEIHQNWCELDGTAVMAYAVDVQRIFTCEYFESNGIERLLKYRKTVKVENAIK